MSGYLSPALLLLLLLVYCILCGAASAELTNMDVELSGMGLVAPYRRRFFKESCENKYSWPPLVGTNSVMIAFIHITRPDCRRYIVTKYIETEGDNWGEGAIKNNGENWKGELSLVTHNTKDNVIASVANNDSVCVFLARVVKYQLTDGGEPPKYTTDRRWKFKAVFGKFNATGKQMVWNRVRLRDNFVNESTQKELGRMNPSDGFGFLTEDKTFVFIFPGKQHIDQKNVFVVGHTKYQGRNMTFHYVGEEANCSSNFFLWDRKIFMVPRDCPSGNRSDYEVRASDDMGQSWERASGPLAEKLHNLNESMDFFTTITIAGRRVLLFTGPTSRSSNSSNVSINLFLVDEHHFEDLGPIVTNGTGISGGSFYYANDELFFLSMRSGNAEKGIVTRLKVQLEKIKLYLFLWYGANI